MPASIPVYNIYQLRVQRGYTQQELARRMQVAAVTVQRIEEGRANPSHVTLCKLAKVLRVSQARLRGLEG